MSDDEPIPWPRVRPETRSGVRVLMAASAIVALAGIALILAGWSATPAEFYRHIYVPDLKQKTEIEVPGLFLVVVGAMIAVAGWAHGRGYARDEALMWAGAVALVVGVGGGFLMAATVYSFPL